MSELRDFFKVCAANLWVLSGGTIGCATMAAAGWLYASYARVNPVNIGDSLAYLGIILFLMAVGFLGGLFGAFHLWVQWFEAKQDEVVR